MGENKKRSYKVDGQVLDVPESEVSQFLKDVPDAVEVKSYIVDNDTLDIPINEVDDFIKNVPDAKPLFIEEEPKKKSTETTPAAKEAGAGSFKLSPEFVTADSPYAAFQSELKTKAQELEAAMNQPEITFNVTPEQNKSFVKAMANMPDALVDSEDAKLSFVANFSKKTGASKKNLISLWNQTKNNKRRLEALESEYLMAPELVFQDVPGVGAGVVLSGRQVKLESPVAGGVMGSYAGVVQGAEQPAPPDVSVQQKAPKTFEQESMDLYELASLYNYFGDHEKAKEAFYLLESKLKQQAEQELQDKDFAARAPKNYIEQRQAPATQGLAYTAYVSGDRAESKRITDILESKGLLEKKPELAAVGAGDVLQPSYTAPKYGFTGKQGFEYTLEEGVREVSRPTPESEYLNQIQEGIVQTSTIGPMAQMAEHGVEKLGEGLKEISAPFFSPYGLYTPKGYIKSTIKLVTGLAESVAGIAGMTTPQGAIAAIPFMQTTTTMMPPEVAEWAMPTSKLVRNYYTDKGLPVPPWAENLAVLGDFALLGMLHKAGEKGVKRYKALQETKRQAATLDEFFAEGIRPEEMERISKVVEKRWEDAGKDPVIYAEQVAERVNKEVKPELESMEAEVTEVPPYNPPPAPESLRTLTEGADVEMNGEVGNIERGDDGSWYFVNDKGESKQIPVADKFNPTEKLSELGIQVLPEISKADIARAAADAEMTGFVEYNGRRYFVSLDSTGKVNPVGDRVFEVRADGTMVDRFSSHPDPKFAADRMLAITNAFRESKGMPKRTKNITPWKESERYEVEGGTIAFEPETINAMGGKGQYLFYDAAGNPRVITEAEYARLRDGGKAIKVDGQYQPGYEGYEQGEGMMPEAKVEMEAEVVSEPKEIEQQVQDSLEIIKDLPSSNDVIEAKKIEGSFLTKKQASELQEQIEANYDTIPEFGQESNDIRKSLYNYDNPYAEKTINGVNLRVAEGLIEGEPNSRNRRKTWLLYANGEIVGKFYSPKDIMQAVKFIEDNLIKQEPEAPKVEVEAPKIEAEAPKVEVEAPKVEVEVEKNLAEIERDENAETDMLLQGEADARRKAGKFTKDGVEYVRNQEGQGTVSEQGGSVRFTSEPGGGGVVVPFKYKLVEAETLQPSHQNGRRNPKHFIPEAQPKTRSDKGSIAAEDSFADKPRFEELGEDTNAYGGAPVVNARNEVIQGNNRSAGLRKGYAKGNKAYYDALMENAEKFGFTKEQVSAMKEPVLVREVKASDTGAIELGNYDVKDLESGGKRRVDPIAVTRRIPLNIKAKLSEVLFKGDKTLNEAIRENIGFVMELLNPHLNTAQRNALFRDGAITEAGISDLQNIFKHFLFDGGDVALPDLFENLKRTQQEGIRKAFPSIFSTSYEKSIIPEIQEAILVMNDYMNSNVDSFAGWLKTADLFAENMYPKDKYSDAALKLAERLDSAKNQKEITNVFIEYAELVNEKPETLFEPAMPGESKKVAIEKILKAEYEEKQKPIGEGRVGEALGKETPEAERPPIPAEGVAPEGSPLRNAIDELRKAKENFDRGIEGAGFAYDPKKRAQDLYDLHKAYVKVAKEAIKEGVRTIEEFARVVSATTKGAVMAFEEAMGRKAKLTLQDFEKAKLSKDYNEPYVFKGKTTKGAIKAATEMPIAQDLKDLNAELNVMAKAAIEGYKQGKRDIRKMWAAKNAQNRAFADQVNAQMQKLRGRIGSKTAQAIVKKALVANTPARMRAFERFAGRAIMNANYVAQVEAASSVRSRLKKLVSGKDAAKKLGANNVAIIKALAKIRPEDILDFDQYFDIAERVIESNQSMRYDKVEGGTTKARPRITNEEVANYLVEQDKFYENQLKQEVIAQHQDLIDMGIIDPEVLSADDMLAIVESIENTEVPLTEELLAEMFDRQIAEVAARQGLDILSPDAGPDFDFAARENKRLTLQEKVLKAFQDTVKYAQMDLETYLVDEAAALTPRQIESINSLRNIDTALLSKDEAVMVNRAIQNIIYNNSFAGVDQVAGVISFNQQAVSKAGKITKNKPVREVGKITRIARSKDLALEKVFGNIDQAIEIKKASGIERLWNTVAEMKNRFSDYYDSTKNKTSFISMREALSKRDKRDYNDTRNRAIRGMYAKMIKNFGGSEIEIAKEFVRHKRQVLENIKAYLSAGGKVEIDAGGYIKADENNRPIFTETTAKLGAKSKALREEGELLLSIYNELFKDANNAAELRERIFNEGRGNVELVERAIEINRENRNAVFESAEMDQNKIDLDYQENYTRDKYKSITDTPIETADSVENLFNTVFSPRNVKDKASGSMNKVVRSDKSYVNQGRVLNFDFDNVFRDALYDDMFASATSKNINQLRQLFRNKESATVVFGSDTNAAYFKRMLMRSIDIMRNRRAPATDLQRSVVGTIGKISYDATRLALLGTSQIFKQFMGVFAGSIISNGAVQAPRMLNYFARGFRHMNHPMLNEFNISQRGTILGGFFSEATDVISERGLIKKTVLSKVLDLRKSIGDAIAKPLGAGDAGVARSSWWMYYLDYLYKKGVDVNAIDFETIRPDYDAAAYAEQMVSRMQNANDRASMPDLYASGDPFLKIIRDVLLPFSSFSVNMNRRMANDIDILYNGTSSQKLQAYRSLQSAVVEQFVFNSMKVYLLGSATQAGADLLSDYFEISDDELEKVYKSAYGDTRKTKTEKVIWNSIEDIFLGALPAPVKSGIKEYVNKSYVALTGVDEEWQNGPFFVYRTTDDPDFPSWIDYLGVHGTYGKTIYDVGKMGEMAITGEYEAAEGAKVEMSDNEKKAVMAAALIDFAALLGVSDQDVSSINTKLKRQIKKHLGREYGKDIQITVPKKAATIADPFRDVDREVSAERFVRFWNDPETTDQERYNVIKQGVINKRTWTEKAGEGRVSFMDALKKLDRKAYIKVKLLKKKAEREVRMGQ